MPACGAPSATSDAKDAAEELDEADKDKAKQDNTTAHASDFTRCDGRPLAQERSASRRSNSAPACSPGRASFPKPRKSSPRRDAEEKKLGYHEPPFYIRPVGENEAAALIRAKDYRRRQGRL